MHGDPFPSHDGGLTDGQMKHAGTRTALGYLVTAIGAVLLLGGIRLGADAGLESSVRAASAGLVAPVGLACTVTGFRWLKEK